MEIRDTGEYAHRRATITDAQSALGASSMTEAVLLACEHASKDVRNKRRALEYAEAHIAGQHVRELAKLLSTPQVPVRYEAMAEVGDTD